MRVDPEILRAFAGQVDIAAADIDAVDVDATTSSAGDALPGSTTQWAVRAVGEHFNRMATTLSQNVTKMGTAVRGADDTMARAVTTAGGRFGFIEAKPSGDPVQALDRRRVLDGHSDVASSAGSCALVARP